MNPSTSKSSPIAAVAVATFAGSVVAETNRSVADLMANITSADDAVRGPAWQAAGPVGAPGVKPLFETMTHPDPEVARAAKRALWQIVRHAGRPGAEPEGQAVAVALVPLISQGDPNRRRECVWMLSEIGGDEAVASLSKLLTEPELREDARAALQRIPGRSALVALQTALGTLPEDYRPAVAVSLRARGEKVKGYPSQKLVPTKQTEVGVSSGG